MKILLGSILFLSLCFSCTEKVVEKNIKDQSTEKNYNGNGLQEQYYPNGQLKMSGKINNSGQKEGIWTSYFENGKKNSESNFKNGLNDGYSMVWYPNGNVRYFGDYANGKKVGEWTFYNEKGEFVKTESF
jgi:antitoxin component YwqK of YwqJK toxin-antitoxin module